MLPTSPHTRGSKSVVAGKFPTPITHGEDLSDKLTEVRSTIKFQLKKVLCLGVAVGHVQMTEDQVLGNVMLSASDLVSAYTFEDIDKIHEQASTSSSPS